VKLSPRRIELLENERWDELPDGPFLRGFLRNVARALDLDATSLTERVDASLMRARTADSILVPQGATHATLPRRSGPVDDRHGGRLLVISACIFAVIAALVAWSGTDSFDRTLQAARSLVQPSRPAVVAAPPAPVALAPDPVESRPGDGQPSAPVSAPVSAPSDAAATVLPAKPTEAVAAAADAEATASHLALTFHFKEESWVEVRAADGKVLMQRLNAAGSEQEVDGEAPYSLIVGNAKGVELRFRGQPVDLGPHTHDQVARLTLS
jgi:cytoskeleton protein RodZ